MSELENIRVKQAGLKSACASCSVLELCLPLGLNETEVKRLDDMIVQRIRIKKGSTLYRQGDPLLALYAVRQGFFKTTLTSEDGREQVTGFQMTGEMLGMDAISDDHHACNAVALEDSEVCPIHFSQLERLSRDLPSLQHNLNKLMSREIVRDHSLLLMMGNMNSDERLAAFFLNLSQRLAIRGYSPFNFILRMRREEIGSYLGLRLETISRGIAKLRELKLVNVDAREVKILDMHGLKSLVAGCAQHGQPHG
ncbi:fumarate/nitrate reduction transcriptional regulator Fnr [Pseudomonas gingeri]|uniref:fumarate/nitrate reduction transcriptional regulator Fnr n=1 Tax=Pseudomonas gingeri TaxID=117681 RepID=UPI0015A3114D|nr:fumarate/nitrate reduction transcriptional regulator Fnr [Pseudomonas gingeri]NWA09452.1 fumarate/nitrate reduction transcriptional regulator Fnr [Pseudomonas gingeri]